MDRAGSLMRQTVIITAPQTQDCEANRACLTRVFSESVNYYCYQHRAYATVCYNGDNDSCLLVHCR